VFLVCCCFFFNVCTNVVRVDQFFSILAKYLRNNPCYDRDDLEKAIQKCYRAWWQKLSTKTHKLETAANISEWLEPYINNLPEITKPLQMHLFKNDAKHVVVQQRDQCGLVDAIWKSMSGTIEPNFTEVSILTHCLH
jgi:hypothetical protein